MELKSTITVVLGPTAAGKTGTGIQKAQKVNGAVISADSRQIYAGFNIGTAKPEEGFKREPHDIFEPDTVQNIPHYFLNTYSPTTHVTLNQWQQDAYDVIDKLDKKDTPLFLVGGTMLYIDSIVFNYRMPQVSANEKLRAKLEQESAESLYEKLRQKDPSATKFIEAHNKMRIIRALEVIEATGEAFSVQRQMGPAKYNFKLIGVFPGWDQLTQNISVRIDEMLEQGLVEETQYLIERYGPDLPLLKTMNYIQIIKYLNKEYSKEKAIEEMNRANLRYARRQMSWWKRRRDIEWLT